MGIYSLGTYNYKPSKAHYTGAVSFQATKHLTILCGQHVLPKDNTICLFDGIYEGLKGLDQRNYRNQVLLPLGYVHGTNRFLRRLVLCLLAEGLRLLAAYSEKSGASRRMICKNPIDPDFVCILLLHSTSVFLPPSNVHRETNYYPV